MLPPLTTTQTRRQNSPPLTSTPARLAGSAFSPPTNPPSVDGTNFSKTSQDVSFGAMNKPRFQPVDDTQPPNQTKQPQGTSSQPPPANISEVADNFYRPFLGPPNLPKTTRVLLRKRKRNCFCTAKTKRPNEY